MKVICLNMSKTFRIWRNVGNANGSTVSGQEPTPVDPRNRHFIDRYYYNYVYGTTTTSTVFIYHSRRLERHPMVPECLFQRLQRQADKSTGHFQRGGQRNISVYHRGQQPSIQGVQGIDG